MSQKLNSLKNQGKIAGWWDFRNNSLLDKSGNGNDIVQPTLAPGHYANTERGRAIVVGSGAADYVIPHDSSLNGEDITVLVFGRFTSREIKAAYPVYYCKRDAAGNYLQFYGNTSGGLSITTGLGTSENTTDLVSSGANMLGVTSAKNGIPLFYKNGNFIGFGGTSNIYADTSATPPIVLGQYYSGRTNNVEEPITLVVQANCVLTGEEISEIYNEYMNERGVLEQPRRGYLNTAPPIEGNCALAYDMETRAGGQVADLSGNSNNATISGGLVSSHLFSDLPSLKNSALGNLDFSALTLGTKHTIEFVADGNTNDALLFDNGTASFYAFYYVSNTIRYLPKAGVGVIFATGALDGKEHHFIIDRDDTSVSLYMDGNLISTETLASNETFNTTTKLTHDSFSWQGNVGYAQIYTVSKGATWAAERYAQYAKHPNFLHDMNDTPPTLANVTSGKIGLSEFQVSTGTWKVSEDAKPTEGELLIDGDAEAVGTAAWYSISGGIATKETTNPYSGTQVLRNTIIPGDTVGSSGQNILTIGSKYRITGVGRGDGNAGRVAVSDQTTGDLFIGTSSATWQPFDLTFIASSIEIQLGTAGGGGAYTEFDNVSVVEVGEGKKWIENVVAGVAYTKSLKAYGTWVFEINKQDASISNIGFISSAIAIATQDYKMTANSNESLTIARQGVSNLMTTAASYISADVDYRIAVTRRYDGQFTLYIKGGLFTAWTLVTVATGSNPATNNTTTTSQYISADLDAGDKLRMLGVHEGTLGISELSQLY